MQIKTIKKSISINAPKEKVWEALMKDEFNRIWYAEFSQGTYADTTWEVGTKAIFRDESNSGIVGTVTANQPGELLSIEYTNMINQGVEDYDSEMAKGIKGSQEIYRLVQQDGTTTLDISCDMSEEFYDTMSASWDRALLKLKEMAESMPVQ